MQEVGDLENNKEAMEYVQKTYGGVVIEPYFDRLNKNHLNKRVGFIYRKGDTFFFMRFRPGRMSMRDHYLQVERAGQGFGFNRSEIEKQIHGMILQDGKVIKEVWCMVVFPDRKVYVVDPFEVKGYIRRFNTTKSSFRNPNVPDEDEDIFNIDIRLLVNFQDFILGKRKSEYDWRNVRILKKDDYLQNATLDSFRK
jgi:hypothetical protein